MYRHVFVASLALRCGAPSSPPPPNVSGPAENLGQPEQNPGPNNRLATRTCGPWQIHWVGEPPGDPAPPRFGTRALHINHQDGSRYRFQPTGELYFSDWSYEPCSPKGAWVALLQDRYGPIHVVASENLGAYLNGASGHQVVSGNLGEIAHVHSDLQWIDAHTLRYAIGGSPAIYFTHDAKRPHQSDRRVEGSGLGTGLKPDP